MIEDGSRPTVGRVTNRTVGRKSGRDMIRVRRSLKVGRVTTGAISRRTRKASVHVTLRTLNADVRACEQETGHCAVIEGGATPRGCGVALLARGREPS